MKTNLSNQAAVGAIVIVVVLALWFGYRQLAGATRRGERPNLPPQMSRMYPMKPSGSPGNPP